MSDIFISYAREDLVRAQALAELFERCGWSTFWDRTIPFGMTWRQFIGQELDAARCLVVLWSAASVDSDWVHEEADEGLHRGILVPVLIGPVRPPLGFRKFQAADLSQWDGSGSSETIDRLTTRLRDLLGEPTLTSDSHRLSDSWQPGDTFRDGPHFPEMVILPAGTFMMGSSANEKDRGDRQVPRHSVTLGEFAIGKFPVTFAQFDSYCEEIGAVRPKDEGWGRGQRPVINVSWITAQLYLDWLTENTRRAYRLPSEAEWEYACRAGTTTLYAFGDEFVEDQANTGKVIGKTSEVGSFPANAFGLHDMHGNVWEWVDDWRHDSYDNAPRDGRSWRDSNDGDAAHRMVRGGSWYSAPGGARSADRSWNRNLYQGRTLGFRVACSPPNTDR